MGGSVHDNEAKRERGEKDKGILSNQSLSVVSEGCGQGQSRELSTDRWLTASLTRSPPYGAPPASASNTSGPHWLTPHVHGPIPALHSIL